MRRRKALVVGGGLLTCLAGCVTVNTPGSTSNSDNKQDVTRRRTPTATRTRTQARTPTPTDVSDSDIDSFENIDIPTQTETPEGDAYVIDEEELDEVVTTPKEVELVDDYDTVREDYYSYYTFTLNRDSTVTVRATVRTGPLVDFIFTTPSEFRHFENGSGYRYYSELSSLESYGYDATASLGAGDYVLVVDNSSLGEAEPPTNYDEDPVTFELKVTAT